MYTLMPLISGKKTPISPSHLSVQFVETFLSSLFMRDQLSTFKGVGKEGRSRNNSKFSLTTTTSINSFPFKWDF